VLEKGADSKRDHQEIEVEVEVEQGKAQLQEIKKKDQPEREPFPQINICTRTDVVKEVFSFEPSQPTGFYIPDHVDPSNSMDLFKLFFDEIHL